MRPTRSSLTVFACTCLSVIAKWKIVYDQHGEETLRLGVKDQTGEFKGGYVYQQNCYQIFDRFFLEYNAFHKIADTTGSQLSGSLFGSAFGGAIAPPVNAAEDVKVEVACTLLEFYHGCVKLVVYKRQTLGLDGYTVRDEGEDCVKTVIVKPGMTSGTTLRYKGEGNEQYKRPPTDLQITLVDETSSAAHESYPEVAK